MAVVVFGVAAFDVPGRAGVRGSTSSAFRFSPTSGFVSVLIPGRVEGVVSAFSVAGGLAGGGLFVSYPP